ncbi:MAG: hypothetical protein ISS49_08490 [Anaerolineae bacterium]|nr:hypothetical protein [Anaerolineae bacterium]
MRRHRFDEVLDQILARVEAGESVDEVLCDYPEQAAELRGLLKAYFALTPLREPVPPPPGRLVTGRRRLLREARLGQPARRETGRLRAPLRLRWAFAVAAALTLVLCLTTGVAAAQSLPGDLLYPLKLTAENVQLALVSQPGDRANLHLDFAARRLDEVLRLVECERAVAQEDWGRPAQEVQAALPEIVQAEPEEVPRLLQRVIELTEAQQVALREIRLALPQPQLLHLDGTLKLLEQQHEFALQAMERPELLPQPEFLHLTPTMPLLQFAPTPTPAVEFLVPPTPTRVGESP